jgi:hypothetical protein
MQNYHYDQQNVYVAVFLAASGKIKQLRRLIFTATGRLPGTIGSA